MKRILFPVPAPSAALFLLLALAHPVAGSERDAVFAKTIEELFPKLVETRRHLHANPELSNEEEKTTAYVAKRLTELGLEVKTGVAKHGIVALLHGSAAESDRCVALRADMDALPITQLSSKPYRSQNPGVMHACGHDVHTTVALGVAEVLSKHQDQFSGTVRTYDEAFRDSVTQMMYQILDGITAAHGASHTLDYRKGYPSVYNDPKLVEATLPTLRRIAGEANVIESIPGMGGEDFSHFAKVSPGFYFRLGVSNEAKGIKGEIHTPAFDVDEECLKTGVAGMAGVICDFLSGGK